MVAEGWEIREEITAKFLFFSSQCAMDFEWTLILSWLLFSTRNSFVLKPLRHKKSKQQQKTISYISEGIIK